MPGRTASLCATTPPGWHDTLCSTARRCREGGLCGHVRKVARQAALQCRELLHDDAVGELRRECRLQPLMIT